MRSFFRPMAALLMLTMLILVGCGSKATPNPQNQNQSGASELKGEIEVTVPAGDYLTFI
ncbi:MAG TPA: hypothetical protein VIL07_12195 [Symbiobacteriaceae bacterium]